MSKNKPNLEAPVVDMKNFEQFDVAISQIPPMDIAFQHMALTDYELLVATIYQLNALIKVTNEYTLKISDILKWLLNEGMKQAIIDQLNVWLEDGTMEELINETLFNMKLDKTTFEEFVVLYEEFKEQTGKDINDLVLELSLFKIDIDDRLIVFKEEVELNIENFKEETNQKFADFKENIDGEILDLKTDVDERLLSITNSIATYIYPSDLEDDLDRLNSILETGGTFVFKKGEYRVGGDVSVASDSEITFENGAYIKRLPTERNVYRVIKVADVDNVILNNLHILGDRNDHLVETGDGQGTCLAILNSTNVTVNGGKFLNSWGDGIYIGHEFYGNSTKITEQVYINDVFIDNSQRNGISLCGGDVVQVKGGVINNTEGKSPEAGIDIEPEGKGGVLPFISNVLIDGVSFDNNKQRAFAVNLNNQEDRPGNVMIKNCNVINSRLFATVNGSQDNKNSTVVFDNNIGSEFNRGAFSIYHDYRGLLLRIINNTFKNYMLVPENDPRYDAGLCVYNNSYASKYLGNVFAENNIFTSDRPRNELNAISIGGAVGYESARNVTIRNNRLYGRYRYGDQNLGLPSVIIKDNDLTTLTTTGNATLTTTNFYEKVIFNSGSTSNLRCVIPQFLTNTDLVVVNNSNVYVDCEFDFSLYINGEAKTTHRMVVNSMLKIYKLGSRYIGEVI